MSSAIPYTVEPHPQSGLSNVKMGLWFFLASEVMLFGALFASYILLRVGAEGQFHEWAEILDWRMAFANTVVLITSSVTMVMAWASLVRNQFPKFKLYMSATILLAGVFMVIKFFEYNHKFHLHEYPSSNTFLALYFTLTGLHGLHVVGGALYNAYLLGPGSKMWKTQPQQFTNRVEASGLFWHFVDLVWIFLFPVFYLLT